MNNKKDSVICDISNYRYTSFDKELSDSLTLTEINAAIARSFISYRTKNQMTQIDVAKKLGVNQSMIAKLEKGDYNPSIKFLFEISNNLSGDYTFFIDIISQIRKIAKENDSRNKEIIEQIKNNKKAKKLSQKHGYKYLEENFPKSMVSEDSEDYKT